MEPLEEAIIRHIREYLTELGEINGIKIREVRWVRIDQLKDLPEVKRAYSGKEFEINPKGTIAIMEQLKNGAQNETLGFQCTLTCLFEAEKEEFRVTNMTHLLVYKNR